MIQMRALLLHCLFFIVCRGYISTKASMRAPSIVFAGKMDGKRPRMPVFSDEEEAELQRIMRDNENRKTPSKSVPNATGRSAVASTSQKLIPLNKPIMAISSINGTPAVIDPKINKILVQREILSKELSRLDAEVKIQQMLLQRERLRKALDTLDGELSKLRGGGNADLNNTAQVSKPAASSKMPVVDEEELRQLLQERQGSLGQANPRKGTMKGGAPPMVVQPHVKPLMEPNKDWRAAMTAPAFYHADFSSRAITIGKLTPPPKSPAKSARPSIEDDFELDFDYDDLEQALKEEQLMGHTGGGGVGVKHSRVVKEHDGLRSGDVLPPYAWSWLKDSDANTANFSSAHRNSSDIVILAADPRRFNEEFKLVTDQLTKVPKSQLNIELAAVNCDGVSDMRKVQKRNKNQNFVYLADESKKFMDILKCRTTTRLSAALVIIDVDSSKIVRIWYESDWDAFTTKDMIVEEVKSYRKNPVAYIQSQIGIR